MKYCQNCGSEIQEGASFCTSCGSKLPQSEPIIQNESNESIFGFEDHQTITENRSFENGNTNQNSFQNQNNENNEPLRTNSMCLVGFILSFFFSFIGLIVSCVGLSQLKKNPYEKGKGLAIAGIIIGVIGFVIQFIWGFIQGMAMVAELGA